MIHYRFSSAFRFTVCFALHNPERPFRRDSFLYVKKKIWLKVVRRGVVGVVTPHTSPSSLLPARLWVLQAGTLSVAVVIFAQGLTPVWATQFLGHTHAAHHVCGSHIYEESRRSQSLLWVPKLWGSKGNSD